MKHGVWHKFAERSGVKAISVFGGEETEVGASHFQQPTFTPLFNDQSQLPFRFPKMLMRSDLLPTLGLQHYGTPNLA
jgi:hypothetical protein